MKKRILAFLFATVMLFSFVSVSAEEATVHPDEKAAILYANNTIKSLIRAYAHDIADNYYYGIADTELLFSVICSAVDEGKVDVNKAVEAMIKALKDEYAAYYSPTEYAELMADVSGEFSGIGVVISIKDKGVFVSSVMENSPALKAGIMAGDYIIGVNGTPVVGLDVSQVRNLIVGATNTEVTVKILRNDKEFEVVCVRDKVSVSNIETKMLEKDIAYLRILQFAKNTPEEVRSYVKQLQSEAVKKLVIDLRDNPGGDLEAAIAISSIFVSAGHIAEIRYKDESKNTVIKSKNYSSPKMKIAVLVNENSASASEFFSMAVQSRKAGTIVGTKTFGKGSMQTVNKLYTGAGIKYTVGEFYSIKGDRVHTIGITPDVYVENEIIPVNEEEFAVIDYDKMEEAGKDGEMTLALEQRLHAIKYLEEAPDEKFGDNTSEAVKKLQNLLGYEATGIPGFYEYLYLNDLSYDFDIVVDKQIEAAVDYLKKVR